MPNIIYMLVKCSGVDHIGRIYTSTAMWMIYTSIGIVLLAGIAIITIKIISHIRVKAEYKRNLKALTVENGVEREAYYKRKPRIFVALQELEDSTVCYEAELISEIIVGRSEGDMIIRDDSSVSGSHCKITMRDGSYYLADLMSSNGTWYDGKCIHTDTCIIPGKVLEIGRHQYRLTVLKKPGEIYHI